MNRDTKKAKDQHPSVKEIEYLEDRKESTYRWRGRKED